MFKILCLVIVLSVTACKDFWVANPEPKSPTVLASNDNQENNNQAANNSINSSVLDKVILWFKKTFVPVETKPIPKKKTKKILVTNKEVEYIVVNKSERKMYLKNKGKVIKEFNIFLGTEPVGKKTKRHDLKTPEGLYTLGYKNKYSSYYKSIRISYPNQEDIRQAKLKNLDPGDYIMIHGMPNKWKQKDLLTVRGNDWTEGCIALNNSDMDEVWRLIKKPGIYIKINP